jgi:hypothetical protein
MLPLLKSEKLADCIIGCALQHADIESLVGQHSNDVKSQFSRLGNLDQVVNDFHAKLHLDDVIVNKLDIEDIYVESDRGRRNREAWRNAKNLSEGRANVRRVSDYDLACKELFS